MSSTKITQLTPEQIARFPELVDRWTKIGLSTEPVDRTKAEAAIAEVYHCGGLEPPKVIQWFGSPFAMIQSITKSKTTNVGDSVKNSVSDSVWNSVRNSVKNSVRNSVKNSVRNSVWNSVWNSVKNSVSDSVWNSVRNSVKNSVSDSVWNSVSDSVWNSVYGSHEAGWLSSHSFFREVCNLKEETEKLSGLLALAETCGWIYPMKDICLVSERHCVLKRDLQGSLHCENGPAVGYPDGWEIYSWHGITIPKEWITERDKLDPQIVLTHKNLEQRRAVAEIIGWSKVLASLKTNIINKSPDPEIGVLFEVDLPDAPNSRFLKVRCATGRDFVLPVPREMKSALEANAWTYGLDAKDFKLEVRT